MDSAHTNISHLDTVAEFFSAIRDRRIEDMLALVDHDVACNPLARPGLSTYAGHGGMIQFASDMHSVHGDFHLDIEKMVEDADSKVTATFAIFSAPGRSAIMKRVSR